MGDAVATQLYSQLQQEWQSTTSTDSTRITQLLSQLKIQLAELGLLFPSSSSLESGPLSTTREILEIGAIHSIRTSDTPSFERYLSLLDSSYYQQNSPIANKLEPSKNQAAVTGLNLLRLLSLNRIAEFHTVLETLDQRIVESKEVNWVLKLERSLMEGSYSRVWSLCRSTSSSSSSSTLPLPEFSHFTSTLISTVRNEIATCDEKAYSHLPLVDAKTLLFFDSENEVKEFAGSRNWYLDPSTNLLHFPSSPLHPSHLAQSSNGVPQSMATGTSGGEEDLRELDRNKVVSATIGYAKELESIV